METDERPVQGPPRPDVVTNRSGRLTALEQAEIDAEAARLRSRGMTYRQIGRAMGCSHVAAQGRVQRALAAVASEAVEEIRQFEGERLDHLVEEAERILATDHVVVSHGKVIRDDQGIPLLDDAPRLRAIAELRALSESRRKLHGADAPARTEHKVTFEETTVTDNEIRSLIEQMKTNDEAASGVEPA